MCVPPNLDFQRSHGLRKITLHCRARMRTRWKFVAWMPLLPPADAVLATAPTACAWPPDPLATFLGAWPGRFAAMQLASVSAAISGGAARLASCAAVGSALFHRGGVPGGRYRAAGVRLRSAGFQRCAPLSSCRSVGRVVLRLSHDRRRITKARTVPVEVTVSRWLAPRK